MRYTSPQVVHEMQPPGSQLCWAACIKMAMTVKRDNATQTADWKCEAIASSFFYSGQDAGGYPDVLKAALERYGATNVVVHTGVPTWDTIKQEVLANHPVIVGVHWNRGGGHAMVIGGFEEESGKTAFNWVSLNDPGESGAKRIFFDKLKKGNYDGSGLRGENNPIAIYLTYS